MDKRRNIMLAMLLASLFLSDCGRSPQPVEAQDVLFQYSTLGSLLAGVYDGAMDYAEIRRHGDFGLGTFNALDGEMIEVDGQVYQVKANGVAYPVDDAMQTPFAVVTHFEADQTFRLEEPLNYDQLKESIDARLPTKNIAYAIRIEGNFSYMKTRSVPRQERPYPPLLDVLKDQPTFEFENAEGVMAGFRLPEFMDDANAPGYHFHFINRERNAGGHVLECRLQEVRIEIDDTHEWYTVLPQGDDFYRVSFSEGPYH